MNEFFLKKDGTLKQRYVEPISLIVENTYPYTWKTYKYKSVGLLCDSSDDGELLSSYDSYRCEKDLKSNKSIKRNIPKIEEILKYYNIKYFIWPNNWDYMLLIEFKEKDQVLPFIEELKKWL